MTVYDVVGSAVEEIVTDGAQAAGSAREVAERTPVVITMVPDSADSEAAIRALAPDFQLLQTVSMRGCIVTARSDDSQYDFVSRFFAPGLGVNEDPVTGSAHCCLGPFWSKRLKKEELMAYQASTRGGVVRMRILGDRIVLSGKAVTVLQGDLL